MSSEKSKSKIPFLVSEIKRMQIKSNNELLYADKLFKLAHEEWSKLRNQYRVKLMRNKKFSKKLYAKYEAEEQIVVGLIGLLHQTIINFFYSKHI